MSCGPKKHEFLKALRTVMESSYGQLARATIPAVMVDTAEAMCFQF
jgi:hypothetical protein